MVLHILQTMSSPLQANPLNKTVNLKKLRAKNGCTKSWRRDAFKRRHLFNLAVKISDQQHTPSTETTTPTIQVIIPFQEQASVNVVKTHLTDLSSKFSPCSSAGNSTKTFKFEKSSQPLLINNAQFINLNVTCVMQDMLVTLTATSMYVLMDKNKNLC